ncbi:MAG: hypothetical protein HQM08_24515 [Candidatus Riflebacteria bacterium]|nr:hypothetical protein [Candidatus Riflebacteria bacterium]
MKKTEFLKDVEWLYGETPEHLDNPSFKGAMWEASPGRFLLTVPRVARYLVEDGSRITITIFDGATGNMVNRFLKMTPTAALLYQRNIMALQAAVVVGAAGAVLLTGNSSSGKSTLLAALVMRGYRMMSDDLAVLDLAKPEQIQTVGTFSEIALWPDVVQKLIPPFALSSEKESGERVIFDLSPQFVSEPVPLLAIFQIDVKNIKEVEEETVQGAYRFRIPRNFTYNAFIADALFDHEAYFQNCAVLARNRLVTLRRPRAVWRVDELSDRVGKVLR